MQVEVAEMAKLAIPSGPVLRVRLLTESHEPSVTCVELLDQPNTTRQFTRRKSVRLRNGRRRVTKTRCSDKRIKWQRCVISVMNHLASCDDDTTVERVVMCFVRTVRQTTWRSKVTVHNSESVLIAMRHVKKRTRKNHANMVSTNGNK